MVDTPGRLSLWSIEIFLAIADAHSMSGAAKQVGASVSAVSTQLSNLEAALGAALVDRTARPLTLTVAGTTFRPRAQAILDETALARTELAMGDLSAMTRVRFGVIEDFDADVTPALLSEMAVELSRSQFLLETGASHRLYAQLDTRALDMIVAADIGAADEDCELHPLLAEPYVAALPRGRAVPRTLTDLSDLPFIGYTQRHHMGRQIAAHLARQAVPVATRFELDSYHAILAMVASGAGWTILTPLGYLRARRFQDDTVMVPLPGPPLARTISLVARRGVMGEMPEGTAARLRRILAAQIVAPAISLSPWLKDDLRILVVR